MKLKVGSAESAVGLIKSVDLREVWIKEAYDFTPWLATNIDILSETLGMDLELRAEEAAVGGFSLDLLAHDLGGDRSVIIENQLSVTDHDHLGKLMTYAAGYDAGVAVWIASSFREEHRQALDWMNQRTDSSTEFFGIVVEAWQIDNSRPACNLKIVSSPNSWQKSVPKKAVAAGIRGQKYQHFFQLLINAFRELKLTKAQTGLPQNWYSFTSGIAGVTYGTAFASNSRIRAEVFIGRGEKDINKAIFDHLCYNKEEIEAEFGAPLEWERLDDRNGSRIAVYRSGNILDETLNIDELISWNIGHLVAFKKVLMPRIQNFLQSPDVPSVLFSGDEISGSLHD